MNVVKWHPVNEVMENLLRSTFDNSSFPRARMPLQIALDAYETENDLVITAALPGATKNDFAIDFEERALTIKANLTAPELPEGARQLLNERNYGSASRTLRIPANIDIASSRALFNNGLLEIHLSKTAQARKKSITIE